MCKPGEHMLTNSKLDFVLGALRYTWNDELEFLMAWNKPDF